MARYYDFKTGNYSKNQISQINYEKEASYYPIRVTKLKDGALYNKNRSAKIAIHVVPLNSSQKSNHIDYDPTIDVKHPPSVLAYTGLVLINFFRGALAWLVLWLAAILLLNPQTNQFNWYLDIVAVFSAMLLISVLSWAIDRYHLISVIKNNHEIYIKLSKLRWKPAFILTAINSIMVVTAGIMLVLSFQQLENEQSNLVILSGLIASLLAILIIYILWLRNASRVATIEHSQILDTLRLTKEYTIRESWGWTTISVFTRIMIVGIISYLNIGLIEKSDFFTVSQADLWLSAGALTGLVGFLHYTERQVNRRLICYFLNYCHQLPRPPSMLLDAYREDEANQANQASQKMNNVTQMNQVNNMNQMNANQGHNEMSGEIPPQQYPINKLNDQPVAHDYLNETGTKKIPVSIRQCPICHSEVKSIYNFCFECGTKLEE
ncbi:MAG: hypothetical protein ACTSYA_11365 [Candidatus Kariarchaeaceae archaeon]